MGQLDKIARSHAHDWGFELSDIGASPLDCFFLDSLRRANSIERHNEFRILVFHKASGD